MLIYTNQPRLTSHLDSSTGWRNTPPNNFSPWEIYDYA